MSQETKFMYNYKAIGSKPCTCDGYIKDNFGFVMNSVMRDPDLWAFILTP